MKLAQSRRAGVIVAAAAVLMAPFLLASPATAAPGDDGEVYDSIPAVLPVSSPSLAYHSNRIAEFGQEVTLGGTERVLDSITVGLVSWACEAGQYNTANDPCVTTTAGASFTHPITVNVYDPSDITTPIATLTQTQTIPFRPSADPDNCTADPRQFQGSDMACHSGLLTTVSFDLSALDVTLPDDIVVSVAFNSTNAGYVPEAPATTPTQPFNVLNVALDGVVPAAIGTGNNAFYVASGAAPVFGGPAAWGVDTYAMQVTVYVKPAVVPAAPTIPPTGMPVEGALLAGLGLLAIGGVFAALTVARRKDAAAQ